MTSRGLLLAFAALVALSTFPGVGSAFQLSSNLVTLEDGSYSQQAVIGRWASDTLTIDFPVPLDAQNLSDLAGATPSGRSPMWHFDLTGLTASSGVATIVARLKDGTTSTRTTTQREINVTFTLDWACDGTTLTMTAPAGGSADVDYYVAGGTVLVETTLTNTAANILNVINNGPGRPATLEAVFNKLFTVSSQIGVDLQAQITAGPYYYSLTFAGFPLTDAAGRTISTIAGTVSAANDPAPTVLGTYEGLANGGFESGDMTSWTRSAAGSYPLVQGTTVYHGTSAVQMGDGGAGMGAGNTASLEQSFVVPLDVADPYFTMWYKVEGTQGEAYDWLRVLVNGQVVGSFFTDTAGWKLFYYNATAHRGDVLTIRVECWTADGATPVNYFVDLASVRGVRRIPRCEFNKDGSTDVFARSAGGASLKLVNDPATGQWQKVTYSSWPAAYSETFLGDFNGDGVMDVLARNPITGGAVKLITDPITNKWASVIWSPWTLAYTQAFVGDFDGDGTDDVLARDPVTGGAVKLITNPTTGAWDHQYWSPWAVAYSETFLGDFDGDGVCDVLARNPTTGAAIKLITRPSNGTWRNSYYTPWALAYSETKVADLDADGVTDALARNPTTGGVLKLITNRWNGAWASQKWASWSLAYNQWWLGDLDGDGASDVLARNPTTGGAYKLVCNVATGGWAHTWFVSWALAHSETFLVDFDGDGVMDVLARNPSTGGVFKLLSDGAAGGWSATQWASWPLTYPTVIVQR